MKRILSTFLLASILTGCSSCIDLPTNEVVEPPPNVERALETIREVMVYYHGPLPELDRKVVWLSGDCIHYTGSSSDNECVTGVYFHYDNIYIIKRFSITVSALTHELIHYYQDVRGDSDSGHNNDWWWDDIKKTNQAIWKWECPTLYLEDACE